MTTFDQLSFALKLFATLGCGLIAGVFFAFSTFVMKALAQQPTAQGIATMQSIHITVINPWFMTAFLGTGVACVILMVSLLLNWQQPNAIYLLVGSLLYLVGTFGVTIAFNVPLNEALAVVKPVSPEGANLWAKYLTNWTFWNHVRCADDRCPVCCNSIDALVQQIIIALAENGTVKMQIQQTFWAARFGMLVDQFGTPWMINCDQPG
ncbi:MAG: DUF1772 domain-containing protein [Leptolyngbyaceae cyanobacterium CSU_1_3]|nr:DUF1772 domain-containing protein [Leptolyngbyaceae cyanobacterium CSU_1_3]